MEGKSGVNIPRLIKNIADQYTFEPEIASLIELIANSLDAKASRIEVNIQPSAGVLEVVDNGAGMSEREFRDYHDFASSTKSKGNGIGFAGQGAKLALNFCSKIITETRSHDFWDATEWMLAVDEAPYRSIGQRTLKDHGTKVTLYLNRKSKNYYSEDRVKQIIYEHYFPLVDRGLRDYYRQEIYKNNLRICVNGKELVEKSILEKPEKVHKFHITHYGRTKAWGRFVLLNNAKDDGLEGVAVCCFGKVIERTFFKKEPRNKERIVGCIEASYLIEAVTTDKCRFQKGNKTWDGFFRKAQKEFSLWLEDVGLIDKIGPKESGFQELEHELNQIIKQIPEFIFFGGRVRQTVNLPVGGEEESGFNITAQNTPKMQIERTGQRTNQGDDSGEDKPISSGEGHEGAMQTRTIKSGIRLAFEDRVDQPKECWFDGETVSINTRHPAYEKSKKKGFLDYHIPKCAVLSITEFIMEKDPEPYYSKVFEISEKFFRIWGQT